MDRRSFLIGAAALAAGRPLGAQPARKLEPYQYPRELDVPYVPTREQVVEEMLRMADVKPNDVVYDLGCGDGRIVVMAAQKFGARGVGVDIDPKRIEEARANASKAGVSTAPSSGSATSSTRTSARRPSSRCTCCRRSTCGSSRSCCATSSRARASCRNDFTMGDDWRPERALKLQNDTIYFWTIPAR